MQGLKCEQSISDPALRNLGDEHIEKTRVFWASSGVTDTGLPVVSRP
ncbi:MAG: hypothetical protein ACJ8BW_38315 [Ktedonobacteraceae bacterium]